MKKIIICVNTLFVLLVFASCSQMEDENISNKGTLLKKYPQSPIIINSDVRKDSEPTTRAYHLKDSIWPNNTGATYFYENDEIAADGVYKRYAYPGAILRGGSIETRRPTPLSAPVDPINISFSFPNTYTVGNIPIPSLYATRQSLTNAMLNKNMHGKQSISFEYNISEISSYEETKLTFGANIDVMKVFNLGVSYTNHKKKRNTLVAANVIHRFYTIDMDLPTDGNLLLNNEDMNKFGPYSPVYVSSVTYGRMGVITVESDSTFSSVQRALNISFNAVKVSGKLSIDDHTETILTNSMIRIYIVGGQSPEATIEGLSAFKNFIETKGEFSIENQGEPLFFSLNYLSDNSPYYTKFQINMPK
nr:thiol-activated cytolysin family protein [uncultured Bacteroides sp.]